MGNLVSDQGSQQSGPVITSGALAVGQSDLSHQQSLERVGLFEALSQASLQRLREDCTCEPMPLMTIFEYLDRSDDVFFVAS